MTEKETLFGRILAQGSINISLLFYKPIPPMGPRYWRVLLIPRKYFACGRGVNL